MQDFLNLSLKQLVLVTDETGLGLVILVCPNHLVLPRDGRLLVSLVQNDFQKGMPRKQAHHCHMER